MFRRQVMHFKQVFVCSLGCNSGPTQFTVNPGDTHYYKLCFEPRQETQHEAHLTLINHTDGTRDEYVLRGHGLEPLKTARLVFDQAKCYQRQPGRITLPSLSAKRRVRFQVSSTLPELLDGPREVWMEPGETAQYEFNLTPDKVEQRQGVIVFMGSEMRKESNPDYDSGKRVTMLCGHCENQVFSCLIQQRSTHTPCPLFKCTQMHDTL